MRSLITILALTVVVSAAVCLAAPPAEKSPEFPAVTAAMKEFVDKGDVSGVVTVVASRDKILHVSAVGLADIAASKPMTADTMFWVASMTKLITSAAVMMCQDDGKLSVDDPVAKYLPELANLKTADGKLGNLTIRHLMTHTSGMPEATSAESLKARKLADLIPCYATKPLQFTPGSKWQYCQSGINSLGRIVEVVSGMTLPEFFQKRIFTPLGMKDTTFYPTPEQVARIAKSYKIVNGKLTETSIYADYDYKRADRAPMANGGIYSTAGDYARFCQMVLCQGTLDGKQYLKPETVKLMTSIQTGDLGAGFVGGSAWGLGWGIVKKPQGPTAALSVGSFGHGGAYGTQAWTDPVKQTVYVLMVQRSDFPNGDATGERTQFQAKAAEAIAK